MCARIQRNARADAGDVRPQARVAIAPGTIEQPAPERAAAGRWQALEVAREIEQLVACVKAIELGFLQLELGGCERGVDHVAQLLLARVSQAAGDPPPCDPELL